MRAWATAVELTVRASLDSPAELALASVSVERVTARLTAVHLSVRLRVVEAVLVG